MSEGYVETFKLAGYGKTGSGKTDQIRRLIDTFGVGNVAILSGEAGLSTIASSLRADMVRDISNQDDLRAAWKWLSENFNRPDAWVAVDGGSRIIQHIADAEFQGAYTMFQEFLRGTRPKDMPAALREFARYLTENDKVDSRAIWVNYGLKVRLTLKKFLELGCNQYWNFLEEQTYISQFEKSFPWRPDAPGSGSNAIVESFDWVFRLTRADGGACMAHTDPTAKVYTAKRRLDRATGITIPDEIADFNVANFYTTIKQAATTKEVTV